MCFTYIDCNNSLKKGQSMLYYICSPYRGATKEEVEKHIKYAKELTRTVLLHEQKFGISKGMAAEIKEAEKLGILVFYRD